MSPSSIPLSFARKRIAFVRHSALRSALRFARAEEGITALEFAYVAPVLLLMVFAIFEFSFIMLVSNMMESATHISSRLGRTGYVNPDSTREETIIASIKQRAGSLINTELLSIETKVYSGIDKIGDAEPWNDINNNGIVDPGEFDDINGNGVRDTDMARAGYGDANDIVVYTVSYPWDIRTPFMREFVGDDNGKFTIRAKAVVKNEPYNEE